MQKRDQHGKFVKCPRGKINDGIPAAFQNTDGKFYTAKGECLPIDVLCFPHVSKQSKEIFFSTIDNKVYLTFPKKHFLVEGHYDLDMCPPDYYNPYTFGSSVKTVPENKKKKEGILKELARIRGTKVNSIPTMKTYKLSELLQNGIKVNGKSIHDGSGSEVKDSAEEPSFESVVTSFQKGAIYEVKDSAEKPSLESVVTIFQKCAEQVQDQPVSYTGVISFGYKDLEDFRRNFPKEFAELGCYLANKVMKMVKV